MYKTLTILFLTAVMAQAQTTLLCEDDFDNANIEGCAFSTKDRPNFIRQNKILEYYPNFSLSYLPNSFNIKSSTPFDIYDTLRLEMNFYYPFGTYNNGSFETRVIPMFIQINYTDPISKKTFSGTTSEFGILYRKLRMPKNAIPSFNPTNSKLVVKIPQPTSAIVEFAIQDPAVNEHSFDTASWGKINPVIKGNFVTDINSDLNFVTLIKSSFCSTTTNPSHCIANAYINGIITQYEVKFQIDNFKAYGIKKVVTGLEDEITPLNTRTLVGMYNSFGQKLDSDQIHEGLVIKMYSDGTKEKVVMK